MFYGDYNPPHFHAIYGEFEAVISISTCNIISENMPTRALELIHDWYSIHRNEFLNNWDFAIQKKQLNKMEPLL